MFTNRIPGPPQEQLIGAAFDQLPLPAFIYAEDSTLVAANQCAQDLLGTPSHHLTGRSCADIMHCQGCEEGCAILTGLSSRQDAGEKAIQLVTDSGREHLAFVRVSDLRDQEHRRRGAIVLFTRVVEQPPAVHPVEIVAESMAMSDVLRFARRVASSPATRVLVDGESGTGKELVARLLHDESRRSTYPFVAINCAAMPEALLESELFGHEKGAFTDAGAQKKGLFELANKGTLFLDEIGELPIQMQAKLLRVFDQNSFRRLGGLRDIVVDIRIVAATNRDLPRAVKQGVFRLDLFHRLNVIQMTIPPLRNRRDDILPLTRFFINKFSRKFKRSAPDLDPASARMLMACEWPGNVRELRNVIERSVLLDESGCLSPESLSCGRQQNTTAIDEAVPALPVDHSLPQTEMYLIANALAKTSGNKCEAARLLGISRDTLRYRLKKRPHLMDAVSARQPIAAMHQVQQPEHSPPSADSGCPCSSDYLT